MRRVLIRRVLLRVSTKRNFALLGGIFPAIACFIALLERLMPRLAWLNEMKE